MFEPILVLRLKTCNLLLLYKHVLQYIKQKCALYAYTTEQIKIDIVWFIETFKIFWSHIHFSTIYWVIYLLVWINFYLQGTVFNSDSKFFSSLNTSQSCQQTIRLSLFQAITGSFRVGLVLITTEFSYEVIACLTLISSWSPLT